MQTVKLTLYISKKLNKCILMILDTPKVQKSLAILLLMSSVLGFFILVIKS